MPTLTLYVSDETMRHFYKRGKPSVIAKQYLEDRIIAEDIKELRIEDAKKIKDVVR